MNKLIFSALLIFFMTGANAQVNFGVSAGINFANVNTGYEEYEFSNTSTNRKAGITIGLLAEIPVFSSVIFQPEINFIQKGVRMSFVKSEFSAMEVKRRVHTLNFVEVPFNFMYNLQGTGRYYIGGGPSVAIGMGGKHSYEHDVTALSGNGDVKFDGKGQGAGESDVHLKPIDIGLNINFMVALNKGFFVIAGYSAGLNSLDINNQWNSYKTNGITLKLGYMFGGRRFFIRKLGKFVSEP